MQSDTKSSWKHATEHSNELFKEADELDALAFDLLSEAPNSPEDAKRFHDARDAANAKFAEAREAWQEAKVELKGVLPKK